MERIFESLWKLNDYVSVQFPGNGIINRCKVIKISFTNSYEPLYDVEVPHRMDGLTVHARLHGIKEWHLRIPHAVELPEGQPIGAIAPGGHVFPDGTKYAG